MKNNKVRSIGRPAVSEKKLEKALSIIQSGFSVSMASVLTKVSTTTIYKFLSNRTPGKGKPYQKRFNEQENRVS